LAWGWFSRTLAPWAILFGRLFGIMFWGESYGSDVGVVVDVRLQDGIQAGHWTMGLSEWLVCPSNLTVD
jgi:hypothetical protein